MRGCQHRRLPPERGFHGHVTLTQYQHIDHLPEDVDSVNDNASVTLANGVLLLSATATATDFDNDQATQTVTADLGGNISFDDDVSSHPAHERLRGQPAGASGISDVALDTDGTVDNNFGADLPGTVRFLAYAGDESRVHDRHTACTCTPPRMA